jgi:hypothetical protein
MLSLVVSIAVLLVPTPARAALGCDPSAATGAPASVASDSFSQAYDPVAHLRMWLELAQVGRAAIDKSSLEDLKRTVIDLRTLWAINPPRSDEITTVLLDLIGLTFRYYKPTYTTRPVAEGIRYEPEDGPQEEIRRLAADGLRDHMDEDFRDLLARKVLAMPDSQPIERRIAATWLAIGSHPSEMKLALFGCARDSDPRLRSFAIEALCGWEDEGVHPIFVRELQQSFAGDSLADAQRAETHFTSVQFPAGSRASTDLAALVKPRLASTDWRAVSQAVALSCPLEHASVVPYLIEALARWKARADSGAQGLRVEFEILRALEDRSERNLGPSPQSWREWWAAVLRGEMRGQTPHSTGGKRKPTRAGAFKPITDRVVFVIDRSLSMDSPFTNESPKGTPNSIGTGSRAKPRTRWGEAVDEFIGFLDGLGANARFNVIVFQDYAESWKPRLAEATDQNKRAAREWLSAQRTGPGSVLRCGIDRALSIDVPEELDIVSLLSTNVWREPDLVSLEADTVVVLSDGDSAGGADWVTNYIRSANSKARMVFDCVEIGRDGDGTLPALARASGGEYVRIDG